MIFIENVMNVVEKLRQANVMIPSENVMNNIVEKLRVFSVKVTKTHQNVMNHHEVA